MKHNQEIKGNDVAASLPLIQTNSLDQQRYVIAVLRVARRPGRPPLGRTPDTGWAAWEGVR